ncbi:hypothetical protein [Pseudodesulfovibrio indicus]|uniref:hypothetical protein n=1 Tax=Pseudodesulfovibrio indicus TaxID=1716143 RepID=UPI00292F2BA0|nr:hypothetical protein [Pseudodesulfovibrio indicus]
MAIAPDRSMVNRTTGSGKMIGFRAYFQHKFNPLHVFCRLRRAGLSSEAARHLCRAYERALYRFIL